tara:strand:- start:3549 stop:3749 length:201 start_codon:yes stop_codon:yes gene_type:complete
MEFDWMFILYTVLLVDSMVALFMSWFGQKWWIHAIGPLSKHFPPAKGWAVLYFVLVLIIGYLAGLY